MAFDNIEKTTENFKKLYESLPSEIKQHSNRVAEIAEFIFRKCLEEGLYDDDDELNRDNLKLIKEAAKYHDIGKALLDIKVLANEFPTEKDKEYIKQHTTNILKFLDDEFLVNCDNPELYSLISDIILFHHEQWDGRGYPNEYVGESIPISARIVSLADGLDHLMFPQLADGSTPLEYEFALKEVQQDGMIKYDPLLITLVTKYTFDLQSLIIASSYNPFRTKPKRKVKERPKKQVEPEVKAPVKEEVEPIAIRDGPPVTFNLRPVYDVGEKVAKVVSLDMTLNDIKLGPIQAKDYFYVAEKSARINRIYEVEFKKLNDNLKVIEEKELAVDLDIHISTRNLKTPNYFENFIKLIEKYPKLRPKLCLTFDSYDFMNGDIGLDKINYLHDAGIKIALKEEESLYNVSRLLSMYEVDYVKLPFRIFKGITAGGQERIAFDGIMQIINNYRVIPIIYDVDNYLQFKKCMDLKLNYLQGNYLGVSNKNITMSLIKPKEAEWIKNE